ncbi:MULTISPECIES: hypothetical protein [Pseudomonas]|uniref:Uncharacterized protein n=1 Tax=Pseudomonas fluorescens TaxID=294 RepID=A0A166QN53_PSEFL|nr:MULTISPECIES: hypothetical protein [Pseudomonas]KZN20569.1 hypothetical protein A1D17_03255 [Pseudomonas fluorescens]
MSETPIDLKDAITELATALKPLEVLAESMRGLDRSHRLQADLQLIKQYYSESARNGLYAQLDDAHKAEAEVVETQTARTKRGNDQRSFEQYSEARGPEQARMAFMSDKEFYALSDAAKKKTSDLRDAHPVLFRVHAQTKKSW